LSLCHLEYIMDTDKIFMFKVDNISFGDLNDDELSSMFTDGRLASHFLERQLTKWFPKLTFVDKKGHDHLDEEGNKYDQKCFTKGGLGFAPSHMGGKGRVFVQEEAHEHAKEITYICCDIVDFPLVKVRFAKGSDLIKEFPKCRIPFKMRNEFFR
jgi:hypothetical protein